VKFNKQEEKNMELKYNVTGQDRKNLAAAIAAITGADKKYLGAPTFAFRVDCFTIDRNGTVSFEDTVGSGEIENLIEQLYKAGFEAEPQETEDDNETDEQEPASPEECGTQKTEISASEMYGLNLSFPADNFSDKAFENLQAIIASKRELFKKSLGVENDLEVKFTDNIIKFDWFDTTVEADKILMFTPFLKALIDMAAGAKRVTAKEKPIDNEKFAMRTFLNRIGLAGTEFKPLRKELLKNLSGNSAFRYGSPNCRTEETAAE